jgi:hypothetical protein
MFEFFLAKCYNETYLLDLVTVIGAMFLLSLVI